jgi:hypothetical protein
MQICRTPELKRIQEIFSMKETAQSVFQETPIDELSMFKIFLIYSILNGSSNYGFTDLSFLSVPELITLSGIEAGNS